MHIASLAAVLLALPQDPQAPAPAWQPPVSVDKPAGIALPWHLSEERGTVTLLAFGTETGDAPDFVLSLFRCAEGGAFERAWKRPLGRFEGPPATAVHQGRLMVVYAGESRAPMSCSVDLATGEASEASAVEVEGLDQLEDDLWPMIVEHEASHYYLCARASDFGLVVLRSEDGGKSWAAVGDKSWRAERKDGTRPLLFSAGGRLHAMFQAFDEAPLAHFTSADGGKSWQSQAIDLDLPAGKTFPMAVHAKKKSVHVILAEMTGNRQAVLHAASSEDGGSTWKLGGRVQETGLDDMAAFCSLSVSGPRLAFTGAHADAEQGRDSVRLACLVSADGGATWRDVSPTVGTETDRRALLGLTAFAADGETLLGAFVCAENARRIEKGCELAFARLPLGKPK